MPSASASRCMAPSFADDLERLVALHDASNIAAVIVEPVAGSTGVLVPPVGYLQRLREICTRHGILLIFDEVITGFGRTGQPFAAQTFGVMPDMITCAKGITNGCVPMGAVLVQAGHPRRLHDRARAPDRVLPRLHLFGAPVGLRGRRSARWTPMPRKACSRAPANCRTTSPQAVHSLKGEPNVIDIRNIGLVGGIELAPLPGEPTKRAFGIFLDLYEKGLLVRTTGDTVALSPPLIIERGADRPDRGHAARRDPPRRLRRSRPADERTTVAGPKRPPAHGPCSTPTANWPATRTTPPRRREQRLPGAGRRHPMRRGRRRRRAGRPVGGDRPAPPRLRRACCWKPAKWVSAPAAAMADRPSTAWPATRRPSSNNSAWTRRARCGPCRSRRWTCCASACREHGIDCDWRDGYLGLATSARKGRALQAWAQRIEAVYGYPLQRIEPARDRPLDRQPALPQRHLRSTLGPPAPAEIHAGPGARGRRGRACACTSTLRCWRWRRATRPALRTARRHGACAAGAAGRQRLPAGYRARRSQARIMPVGTYIACSETLEPAAWPTA